MVDQAVNFKDSKILKTFFSIFILGMISSFVPQKSYTLLVVNIIVSLMILIIFIILWRVHSRRSKRYFSLLSFVMLLSFSYYFSIPLIRLLSNSYLMWIGIGLWIGITTCSIMLGKSIFVGLSNPIKSKLGIYIFVMFFLVIGLGKVVVSYNYTTHNPSAVAVGIFTYLCGMLLSFISGALLIDPEKKKQK
ncbi:hypothetical protein [Falsibacillus albus]|uniref:Uncharacterized protein n=1 Tax=Falsibacillus albus TaxID=2478915 RepID=A0A3L7JM54_9BACI|nr:hypothetical protein [Falsibacillus albus]RLQ91159.1 hypothetical protein D9X91_20940 [Falsibacillus albus]